MDEIFLQVVTEGVTGLRLLRDGFLEKKIAK